MYFGYTIDRICVILNKTSCLFIQSMVQSSKPDLAIYLIQFPCPSLLTIHFLNVASSPPPTFEWKVFIEPFVQNTFDYQVLSKFEVNNFYFSRYNCHESWIFSESKLIVISFDFVPKISRSRSKISDGRWKRKGIGWYRAISFASEESESLGKSVVDESWRSKSSREEWGMSVQSVKEFFSLEQNNRTPFYFKLFWCKRGSFQGKYKRIKCTLVRDEDWREKVEMVSWAKGVEKDDRDGKRIKETIIQKNGTTEIRTEEL